MAAREINCITDSENVSHENRKPTETSTMHSRCMEMHSPVVLSFAIRRNTNYRAYCKTIVKLSSERLLHRQYFILMCENAVIYVECRK